MTAAGYSGTPLAKKLGLKDGQKVGFVGLPEAHQYLTESRAFIAIETAQEWDQLPDGPYDYLHIFTKSAQTLEVALFGLLSNLDPDGMIWISWPKKASKVPTDITEDVIRDKALAGVLVDVKVCAVDDIWSGLKLVIRKHLRADHANRLGRA